MVTARQLKSRMSKQLECRIVLRRTVYRNWTKRGKYCVLYNAVNVRTTSPSFEGGERNWINLFLFNR